MCNGPLIYFYWQEVDKLKLHFLQFSIKFTRRVLQEFREII